MIKFAKTKEDIREVAYMAYNFVNESAHVKVDPEIPAKSYWDMIQNGNAEMMMLMEGDKCVGGLGCIKYPDLHSGELFAVETFWYVLPDYRGAGITLLERFEQWAKDNNCVKCAMIHLVDSMSSVLERLYKMRGYKLVEKHYVKELI